MRKRTSAPFSRTRVDKGRGIREWRPKKPAGFVSYLFLLYAYTHILSRSGRYGKPTMQPSPLLALSFRVQGSHAVPKKHFGT